MNNANFCETDVITGCDAAEVIQIEILNNTSLSAYHDMNYLMETVVYRRTRAINIDFFIGKLTKVTHE